ncbi:MAG: polysaccharide deacetylase family protein [Methylocystis sp.]|uniref:polysaccharide deacetylase family protein n=1 Tax=Methylocystis sp. TaxID=1911079 RepID=UPI003DA4CC79
MPAFRDCLIHTGMTLFRASGAHRLAAPFTRGLGAILMFHRVRPAPREHFAPNAGLEITPSFLDAVLLRLRAQGYDILSLDDALEPLRQRRPSQRPFVVLTFDDGYRDLVDHALPILERRRAPFVAYVTSGFADRTARLWWLELEEAIRRLARVDVTVGGHRVTAPCATAREKRAVHSTLYWRLRGGDETALRDAVGALAARAGVNPETVAAEACLDWAGVAALARHELATIGAHSLTHPRLAWLGAEDARREMAESRARIAAGAGATPRHFCYPVGDPTSAGRREFDLAAQLGFESAVTTQPGMLFPEHRDHLCALPRLSVNGRYQSLAALDVLLSGAPFALFNRGRRVAT